MELVLLEKSGGGKGNSRGSVFRNSGKTAFSTAMHLHNPNGYQKQISCCCGQLLSDSPAFQATQMLTRSNLEVI